MSQTNYTPLITDSAGPGALGPYGSGVGSPEGVRVGFPGYDYVNTSTGDFYVFNGVAGAKTGWVKVTATAGAGGQMVLYSSGTPSNPSVVGSPAIAYDPAGVLPTLVWDTVGHAWH